MAAKFPQQRWQLQPAQPGLARAIAKRYCITPLVAQLLINRGVQELDQAKTYLEPASQTFPDPLEEFPDLPIALDLLIAALGAGWKISICGDYDADGMTSTALLIRALRHLGAVVDYIIPSRMHEGYGINRRIVSECAQRGVALVITVDNGIAAHEAIAHAKTLGIQVIITDHHDLPAQLPPADAILNPKLLPMDSPYRTMAGVGVAYLLALSLAKTLGQTQLTRPLLELFTLGTIADLAPLTGVNRCWLQQGLALLPDSTIPGIQALIQLSGVKTSASLKPEDIGFRLGPRINAIGRIGDPQVVIDLLTTEDQGTALEKAMVCEQTNRDRVSLCDQIQTAAEQWCYERLGELYQDRVIVIVQPGWHHGVIGIVASRLVEKFGLPVFIGSFEENNQIRGSARGIPEFDVFAALVHGQEFLNKFGGHHAAGGFSLGAANLELWQEKLVEFAHQCLAPEHLKPLIKLDAQVDFSDLDEQLWQQLHLLNPCGIANPEPVFWTANVRLLEQKIIGKDGIKLTLSQDGCPKIWTATAWRWRNYFPLPSRLDIAYKLTENTWNGSTNLELELVGVRLPEPLGEPSHRAAFSFQAVDYCCSLWADLGQMQIYDRTGKILAIQKGQRLGWLGKSREDSITVDVSKAPYYGLVKTAVQHLGIE